MGYAPWTEEQQELLRKLRNDRMKVKDIAATMGKSVHAVETQITNLGLANVKPQPTIKTMKALLERYNAGESVVSLSAESGISQRNIYRLWESMGQPVSNRRKMTIRKVKEMHARRVAGERLKDLAAEAGISKQGLRNRWKNARCEPIAYNPCCRNHGLIQSAIKARNDGVKWDDVPAHIGSSKSVNAIRLAVWQYKKKSGS